jgi:hypothetical protein
MLWPDRGASNMVVSDVSGVRCRLRVQPLASSIMVLRMAMSARWLGRAHGVTLVNWLPTASWGVAHIFVL